MWWIRIRDRQDGPFPREEIEKRLRLNLLKSLDQISSDGVTWQSVKDSTFWARPESETPAPSAADLPRADEPTPTPSPLTTTNPPRANAPTSNNQSPLPDGSTESTSTPTPSKRVPHQPSKKLNILLTFFIGIFIILTLALFFSRRTNKPTQITPPPSEDLSPIITSNAPPFTQSTSSLHTNDFKSVKYTLALIQGSSSCGTGFIVRMGTKAYLLSNDHVLRDTQMPRAVLIDGTVLKLGAFSVATDRDLARFEIIDCPTQPLELEESDPNINDAVVMFGNSLGEGVHTESRGLIKGVGFDRLETDVEIVSGNSGSPLLNENGRVLAVAAYIKRDDAKHNWGLKVTRYDGTVRRYAIRVKNVQWQDVERAVYEKEVSLLSQVDLYLGYLYSFVRCAVLREKCSPTSLAFTELDTKKFIHSSTDLVKQLQFLSISHAAFETQIQTFNDIWQDFEEAQKQNIYISRSNNRDSIRPYIRNMFNACYAFIKNCQNSIHLAQSLLSQVTSSSLMQTGYTDQLGVNLYQEILTDWLSALDTKRKDLLSTERKLSSYLDD